MLEEELKIRLLIAAVNLQNIIATLDIDLGYQTLIGLYGSGTKKSKKRKFMEKS